MKIASLKVGQCLTLNNTSYEIIRLLENDIIQLESKIDFKLLNRSKQELLRDHETGKLIFAQSNDEKLISERATLKSRDLSSYDERDQQIAKLRMDYIREARARLGSQPRISELDKVVLLMAQNLGDHNPPSANTLYRWWTRWESSSQDITGLINKKRKRYTTAFSPLVLQFLNKIIEEDFLNRVGNSIQDVYDRLKLQINNFNKTTSRPHKTPSRSSVYRYCSNIDQYEVLLARKGKRVAKQAFRVTGEGVLPDYILARTEIDHTPLDLIIVDDKTFLPIGRPNLTCIIDKFSRVILGFSLSFEPPSELSVIRALKHALFTKTALKELYPDLENDWLAHGIPMCLVVDNGLEFHSNMLRQLCYELNVELVFCPKQQPQFKGCIERTLGTLNRGVSHHCEGTTFNNIEARGDYNSADQARVTLKEANELITHWIVDVYHQRRHSITGYTPDYLGKKVSPTSSLDYLKAWMLSNWRARDLITTDALLMMAFVLSISITTL
jgi:putative transposase